MKKENSPVKNEKGLPVKKEKKYETPAERVTRIVTFCSKIVAALILAGAFCYHLVRLYYPGAVYITSSLNANCYIAAFISK